MDSSTGTVKGICELVCGYNELRVDKRVMVRRSWLIAAVLMLCVSASLNVYLLKRAQQLAHMVNSSQGIPIGTVMPPIRVVRPDGQESVITYADARRGTILYVFSPSCASCIHNEPSIRSLSSQTVGLYRSIGLLLSAPADRGSGAALGISTFVVSADSIRLFNLGTTPETIVISPDGLVQGVWRGTFSGIIHDEVERFFNVRIPEPFSAESE